MINKDTLLSWGWEYMGGFFYRWPYDTYCEDISNRPLSWRANWVCDGRHFKIECYERNAFEWETAYMGPLRNEEDWEYISSLLNICHDFSQANNGKDEFWSKD